MLRFDATVQAGTSGSSPGSAGVAPARCRGRRTPARADALADRAGRRAGRRHQGARSASCSPACTAGGAGFVGDDGAPVPGTDLVAACDAILPSMVERDPEWAGWCAVLVNVNDLAAMGAAPVGLLDAVGGRDASFAARVLAGLRAAQRGVGRAGARRPHPARRAGRAVGDRARPHRPSGARGRRAARPRRAASPPTSAAAGGPATPAGSGTRRPRGPRGAAAHRRRSSRRTAPAAAKDVCMAGLVGTLGHAGRGQRLRRRARRRRRAPPAAAHRGRLAHLLPGLRHGHRRRPPDRAVAARRPGDDAPPAASSYAGTRRGAALAGRRRSPPPCTGAGHRAGPRVTGDAG